MDASAPDAVVEWDGGSKPICSDGCEIVQLVAGVGHTCSLFDDGRVACWGTLDVAERVGLESFTVPTEMTELPPITSLSRGSMHVCGWSTSGDLWCWGDGTEPLLGASAAPRNDWLSDLDGVVDMQTGGDHTCALLADGNVNCWGARNEGQLGDGTMEPHEEPAPVVGLDDVVQLASGAAFNCACTAAGRVACWGDNSYGEIGDGTGGTSGWEADRQSPVFVLTDVDLVTADLWSVCARHVSGALLCWGGDVTVTRELWPGRHGVVSPEVFPLPEGVTILDVQAATLGSHICVLATSGRVLCWGYNGHGEIGYGGPTLRVARAPVRPNPPNRPTPACSSCSYPPPIAV